MFNNLMVIPNVLAIVPLASLVIACAKISKKSGSADLLDADSTENNNG
jgi:hypothetical protein